MNVRDLSPEQRRELLAAWDAAVQEHRRARAYTNRSIQYDQRYDQRPVETFFRRAIDLLNFYTVAGPAGVAEGF